LTQRRSANLAVARASDKIFGPGEIGIRLPSALAMTAGMLITYDIVRRVADRLHGLIAIAVLSCSFLPYYGYEGRAYGLFFLFASAALWTWVGKRSAVILAAVFFFGVLVHYYLVLCMLPLAMDEACHWRPWRRPSGRIIGAALGANLGLLAILPQILGARSTLGKDFWAPPIGRMVPFVYSNFFPAGLFLLAMVILWAVVNERSETVLVRPASAAERLGWFFFLIPLAGYLLAKLVTHAYLDRYFIGVLPGVAVGFACMLSRRFPGMPRISVGILLLLVCYGVATQAIAVRHPDEIEAFGPTQQRTKALLAMEQQIWSSGARYIVIVSSDHLFLTTRHYSKRPEMYVWWHGSGHALEMSPHYPIQYWTLDDVRRHYRDAVFVDIDPGKLETLQGMGIHTRVRKFQWISVTYPD
jgi:hypothetical protein